MSNFSNLKDRIKGPVFSIITPFKPEDDAINWDALENYVELIYNSGGRNFYVMGYNSRFSELSWDEIKALNKFVAQKVKSLNKDNIMIVADPLHCPTKVSTEFANHAKESGADIISIICREKYYSNDQVYNHFNYIASNSEIGILVHEMPFLSGYGGPPVNYDIDLLDRLADIPNIVAVKEDAKDDEFSKKVIEKISDRTAIIISGGGKRQWLRFADIGCQSWLNGIGVFDPRLAVKFWEWYQVGEKEKYMNIINKIEVPFFDHGVKKFGWHLTIKAALESLSIMSRHERLPMLALNDKDTQEVRTLMKALPLEQVLE